MQFAPITLGRAVRVAVSHSFVFTETEHPPGTVLAPHAHENSAISYIIDGDRSYRFGSNVLECGAGALAFVPAGVLHSSHFSRCAAHGLMVELSPDSPRFFPAPKRSFDAGLVRRCDAIRRELWCPDDLSSLTLEALGFELIATRSPFSREPPRWLIRARDALHDSFRRPPSLDAVAADAGVHRSRLTREFRRHFGTSIGQYVRRVRVNHAWQIIAATDLPLCDVAAECGFADQSHMTREFRRAFGGTPLRLRLHRSF